METFSACDVRAAGSAGAFRRILVGFDGSAGAKDALRAAASLAGVLGGEVRVLLVVRPRARVGTPEELALGAAADRDHLFQELAQVETAPGVRLDRRVAFSGDPARVIAQHAEEHGFDLIVVSSYRRDRAAGEGGDVGMEALVQRHPCPVLVV